MCFRCLVLVGFLFFVSVLLSWCLLVFVGVFGGFRVFSGVPGGFWGARRRGNLA